MPLTIGAREGLLDLLFAKTAFGGGFLIDAGTLANLFVSAHEASPGTGTTDQRVNETTYTGVGRISIARTFTGTTWAKYTNQIRNAQNESFPANSGGTTHIITHVGLGIAAHPSAGYLISFTELATPRLVVPGFTLQFLLEELVYSLR